MKIKQGFTLRLVLVLLWGFVGSRASAQQANSWTKAQSGYWEEPFWSLTVLPEAYQSAILFTNAGFKALAIGSETVSGYPGSLTISNLTVSAPADSHNLLLLNYAGLHLPLRVLESFYLGSNATLLALD